MPPFKPTERVREMRDLLLRLRAWDVMAGARAAGGDGEYWTREIDRLIVPWFTGKEPEACWACLGNFAADGIEIKTSAPPKCGRCGVMLYQYPGVFGAPTPADELMDEQHQRDDAEMSIECQGVRWTNRARRHIWTLLDRAQEAERRAEAAEARVGGAETVSEVADMLCEQAQDAAVEAQDIMLRMKAENARLSALCGEWAKAAQVITPSDVRPSMLESYGRRLVKQADEAARLMGEKAALHAALSALHAAVILQGASWDLLPAGTTHEQILQTAMLAAEKALPELAGPVE